MDTTATTTHCTGVVADASESVCPCSPPARTGYMGAWQGWLDGVLMYHARCGYRSRPCADHVSPRTVWPSVRCRCDVRPGTVHEGGANRSTVPMTCYTRARSRRCVCCLRSCKRRGPQSDRRPCLIIMRVLGCCPSNTLSHSRSSASAPRGLIATPCKPSFDVVSPASTRSVNEDRSLHRLTGGTT
ncbi:hypothetical protein BDV95DRAFT_341035 [Massariosphaeria phaeospora]|uniref:Uncharacterized protein n=1 Tax=Massariosphaeria phaeospora TaxID=100035 RepID=A0A7C8MHE9_9PLEO|nr:hypothetical protein BDV95DRAFT_341035 [Massariosphaeria phaeospora]